MIPLLGTLLGIGGDWLRGRQELKTKKASANQAWETAMGRTMENGWKDEYVTVVVTFPIVQNFVGNLVYAFTGKSAILLAQEESMKQIGLMMDTPYGDLMMVVVLAAVGIKAVKALI